MAVMLAQTISGTCRFAVATLRADGDPTAALRGALKPRQTKHHAPLKPEKLPVLMAAIDESPAYFSTKVALKLLVYTLTRSVEVIEARWDEFDLDIGTWVIPAHRMKMREDHMVPLPTQAVSALRQLYGMTPRREVLFPNRRTPNKPASRGILWKAVSAMELKVEFSPHGVRSTGSTILNSMGHRADLIEKQLAHEERSKSRGSYNRATYLEERRDMMQEWADYLDSLSAGDDVVPIKGKKKT